MTNLKLLPLDLQMFGGDPDDNITDLDIDDLFKDPAEDPSTPAKLDPSQMTEAMTARINEVRAKAETETMEKIAKDLGFTSYEELQKAKENELIEKHGYDPKDIEAMIEPLLAQRLADDPRLQKLAKYEARERDAYIQSQLAEINKATGQQLKVEDLPQDTLDLWAKGVELKQAYYATQGEAIITKGISQSQQGSLRHLAPGSGAGSIKTRKLTDEEKDMWRSIVPSITEEELSKKTTQINKLRSV